jgi:hypothetical protein
MLFCFFFFFYYCFVFKICTLVLRVLKYFKYLNKKKGDDLIDVTCHTFDDLIKPINVFNRKKRNPQSSATTNTVKLCSNKINNNHKPNQKYSNDLVYNKTLNTSYIISAAQTPNSMSFVSQASPSTTNSKLTDFSFSLYSSSKMFCEQQNLIKKSQGIYIRLYQHKLRLALNY